MVSPTYQRRVFRGVSVPLQEGSVGLVGVGHIKLWVEVCHDLESGLLVACLPFTTSGSAAVTGLEVEEEMESHWFL